ncbi:glycerol-3-phosphate 1-O-acyltransferase PlsY [Arenibaculum sp.]|jgi:glycerol-3-phosphate acyltransferase PlsY|uniref:glycerol-3-phosphate 1-O-acyltransferase PlsY n=1 Tax=Arenibaculum sp. TaxID=2865862 RepID=UPI002E0F9747|nr:glycerol-3-phosphate 1-O-acyltransferase PlsY [Arenibaculum sp.]
MPDPISWSFSWPYLLAALAGGYLLGSVPFGLVLTRLFGYGDVRSIGSGNIGATNVLRTGNKALAAATLVLDSGKGALAVLLAARFGPDAALLAAMGSMLGHTFPVWLGFKGGKGVATALGVLLALAWPVGLIACALWLLTALAFRISSLSALVALGASPLAAFWFQGPQLAQAAAFIAVLVFVRHHANIRRLLKGEEPRIGRKKI